MEDIDVGVVTPVPRSRSSKGTPMRDPLNSITLRNLVPYIRHMAYAFIDDMVADAWTSPEAVALKLPVAIANLRDKTAAGFQVVTREHATDSK